MLEEAIVNLLLRHNCVVVPAFGGFVAQSSGAIIDMNTGLITPPRKSVLFNKQLINNDGLLIAHLSTSSDMDYVSAESFLQTKVNEWHTQLNEGQRVVIDKIGHLFLDADRNISFEQDRHFNLLLESFGLNKVHFISEEEVKITAPVVFAESEKEETKIVPLVAPLEQEEKQEEVQVIAIAPEEDNRKMWKYIAAAVLLPFAFFTYWIPVETSVLESGMISVKDFNPMYKSGEGVYQQNSFSFPAETYTSQESAEEALAKIPDGTDVFYYKFDDELMIPVRMNSTEAETDQTEEIVETVEEKQNAVTIVEKPTPKPTVKPSAPKMHYITGCFSDRANAEAMVKTMKSRGLDGQILDEKRGMTRVSAGSATNQADFNKLMQKAQKIGYKGWKLD